MQTIYEVTKKRSKWVLVLGVVVAILGIVKGLMDLRAGNTRGALAGLIGVFILIVVFYETVREVNEEGVDEMATLGPLKKHGFWKWEDINYMMADFRRQPPYVILNVRKDKNMRRVRIESKEVQRVFRWAAKRNPNMTILHNSTEPFYDENVDIMTVSEYRETHKSEYRPNSFHDLANEIRRIRREERMMKPDMTRVKVKKPKKKLKSWK